MPQISSQHEIEQGTSDDREMHAQVYHQGPLLHLFYNPSEELKVCFTNDLNRPVSFGTCYKLNENNYILKFRDDVIFPLPVLYI